MKKKIKITADFASKDILIYGISSIMSDYQLVWNFNINYFNFIKLQDFQYMPAKEDKYYSFSYYYFNDSPHFIQYFLISNKNLSKHLIFEYKNFDFILIIKGSSHNTTLLKAIDEIKKIKKIQYFSSLDITKIKHIEMLINELEMSTMFINTNNHEQ
ncbi:MAG: IPExxxVDY family protein [Bacteroidales bacterium]|nr:IPExxxVDY family protein [Bacteroidales bacterium]